VLAAHRVRYVLGGEVAGAVHGWPITLDYGEYLIFPEDAARNLDRLEQAAAALGATGRDVDDPYAGLDVTYRWTLTAGGVLAACPTPAGTRGYRDLRRDATLTPLETAVVEVASLRDLIRVADASPRSRRRAFLPALWATLEQSAQTQRRRAA
jgi:hypothetical protein